MTFNFKTKPYDHQLQALEQSWEKEYYALFMEMGTGKSKVTIDNIFALHQSKQISRVIISAPKGVYLNWKSELQTHAWGGYEVASYSSSMKKKEAEALSLLFGATEGLQILLINIESLSTKKGNDLCFRFIKDHDTMMVIDESTAIKNPKGKRSKAAIKIGMVCKYRRILTGTPITHSPLDLYSQVEFLNKGLSGCPSFFLFKHTYANQMKMTMGNRTFDKVTGYKNLDQLTEQIKPFSYRVLKEDCLDLPEKNYMVRNVELTQEQKLMYMTLKHESLVMLEDGLLTSTNALTTLLKLHQIACGHVKDDFGNTKDIPNNRLDAVMEITNEIDTTSSKVIVWCSFQRDVELLHAALGKKSVTYYGPNDLVERQEALERFKNDPECLYLIGTPQCGGKGLTLNNAGYVIYYSNSFKLEDRLQSEDRCHRIGQNKNVTYIDLCIKNTVDEKILKALKDKSDLADQVLSEVDAFRNLI